MLEAFVPEPKRGPGGAAEAASLRPAARCPLARGGVPV
jgi:hypothetical protein